MFAIEKELEDKEVGRPNVGGPFSLTSHAGKPFTENDLIGKWSLIYFGFTNCPDICPEELDKMSEAVEKIGQYLLCLTLRERSDEYQTRRCYLRPHCPTDIHLS